MVGFASSPHPTGNQNGKKREIKTGNQNGKSKREIKTGNQNGKSKKGFKPVLLCAERIFNL
ncbi:MAG: hypothetical protein BWK80_47225 [Desulfobacteraceae bacterium IS3]|nr:MAG: hypothetical protein BWK80_47225 [Desulfobacteraceae bacterium IS3]